MVPIIDRQYIIIYIYVFHVLKLQSQHQNHVWTILWLNVLSQVFVQHL